METLALCQGAYKAYIELLAESWQLGNPFLLYGTLDSIHRRLAAQQQESK